MSTNFYLSINASLFLAILCSRLIFLASASSAGREVLRVSKDYELLEMVPHDTSSFTQGLTYYNGHIYEGTGLEHQSHIFQHDPSDSMTTLRRIPLAPANFFGEGIAYYYIWANDGGDNMRKEHRLIQLTWKNKRGFIYSLNDGGNPKKHDSQSENSSHLKVIREFDYDTVTGEGWGITFLPHTNEFYISDGSHFLSVWDAESLDLKRKIPVKFERKVMVDGELTSESLDVDYINELEFVDFETGGDGTTDRDSGEEGVCSNDDTECNDDTSSPHKQSMRILANVWYQDLIISIHPETGEVERVYDFRDLYPIEQRQKDGADVLNGISLTGAMNGGSEDGVELWITGKLWPNMYRVRLKQHAT
mmetsp:Transcript_9032/g.19231  ORF Transcript_9032/g.19231 Transcript_9032/m.19231 type:complete len:363 (+) Transcript_9032:52-1140(+)|eukprot:CAMPEP_0171340876 /NCGR_PEP_ID=MMETSP0878-20121228/8841_1 /TAXON_ID=67004 /ORGANISM="Thalassiosira weissflogii, Strain CCMP1336" /LENGTH=362 /DNA_ID=CAMNT_0011842999 /DNA_START=36 /DNA_END=1124 /DNA_ORIENTATION=-